MRWLLFPLLGACAGGPIDTAGPVEPSAFSAVEAQFATDCAGPCHSGTAPSAGLDLSPGMAWAATVGVPSAQVPALVLVAPGDPDGSYLLAKVRGTHASLGGSGNRMPPGMVLSEGEIARIAAWVEDGARP